MPVMMNVKSRAGKAEPDPHTGVKIPDDRFVPILVTSQSMRLVEFGVIIMEKNSVAIRTDDIAPEKQVSRMEGAKPPERKEEKKDRPKPEGKKPKNDDLPTSL